MVSREGETATGEVEEMEISVQDENITAEEELPGFIGTLTLLADLRDKGGISVEGFERIEEDVRRSLVSVTAVAGNIDAVPVDPRQEHDEGFQAVKSEILTALANDASHGTFEGAGSLVEAATRAGASTNEISEALGVTQFTWAIGNLYRSAAALREPSIAGASSID